MELKLKLRGSSLGTSRPQSGQAMEEEKICSSPLATADEDKAVGELESLGDRRLEALFDGGFAGHRRCGSLLVRIIRRLLEQNAVDDGFDGVVLALVEGRRLGEVDDLAIDAGAKALLIKLIEQILKLTLAASDDGRHDRDALAGAELQDALDDLLGGLAGDGAAAVGAVRRADRGVEQAQVVVDLGDGADGGAWAAAGGLLLDGDGGAKAFDGVDVGALDLVEELAGVGRERFDIAALALGVDGVEGERALAGAGETGDHGERVAGDAHVDVAQVMLARPSHRDVSDGHGQAKWKRWVWVNLRYRAPSRITDVLRGILFGNRNKGQRA